MAICSPVNVTQVHRTQKLDDISYLKTLSVWGVSVSITKPACSKSVNWQLKIGVISGSESGCDQGTVAFRLLMQSCWTILRGLLMARMLMQLPCCQQKLLKKDIFWVQGGLIIFFFCRKKKNLNIFLLCSISRFKQHKQKYAKWQKRKSMAGATHAHKHRHKVYTYWTHLSVCPLVLLGRRQLFPSGVETRRHRSPKCFCSLTHSHSSHDVQQFHAMKMLMTQPCFHCISDILNWRRNL